MKLKQLIQDDDNAVSPVIGVILMVAITVILAAVIATFVLGLGESVSDSAPQASFSFDYDAAGGGSSDGSIDVSHDGGATFEAQNLYVSGNTNFNGAGNSVSGTQRASFNDFDAFGGKTSEVSAGSNVTIVATSDGDFDDAKFEVIFQNTQGDSSATLSSWSGPDA